jgi:hypothetical protein
MLFKSQAERKSERDIKIRTGLAKIKRQLKALDRSAQGYLDKARRARERGDEGNLTLIKSALQRTLTQRKLIERQLLTLETALQIKEQAEAHAQFASSMKELSRSIAQAFSQVDLGSTLGDFERAMQQAESLEQRMDIFLDMSEHTLESGGHDAVSNDDIDALIDAVSQPQRPLQRNLGDELADIERELGS